MANPFSKGWKYLMASFDTKIEENADPKVQIRQAEEAARQQHAKITEHAASVIGNRNQLEMKLNRLQKDATELQEKTRVALQQADQAQSEGDANRAAELNQTAELFASNLVTVEQQLEETKELHAAASRSAEEAQRQQQESETRLQDQLNQINQLRAQADQAKMQETANKSMASMNDAPLAPDEAVPTLDKVRDKIESRYANALGAQELVEGSVQDRMTEIAEAGRDVKASSRLAEIRADMEKNKELEQ